MEESDLGAKLNFSVPHAPADEAEVADRLVASREVEVQRQLADQRLTGVSEDREITVVTDGFGVPLSVEVSSEFRASTDPTELDRRVTAMTRKAVARGEAFARAARARYVPGSELHYPLPVSSMPDSVDVVSPIAKEMRELQELLEEAQGVAAQIREAMAEESATSGTKAVQVRLDQHGFLQSLSLSQSWRREVGSEGLSEAILTAVDQALQERSLAWFSALETTLPDLVSNSAKPGFSAGPMAEGSPPMDDETMMRLTIDLLNEFDSKLAKAQEERPDPAESDRPVVASAAQGGGLTALRIDQRWLGRADDGDIETELVAAVRLAVRPHADARASLQSTLNDMTELVRMMTFR